MPGLDFVIREHLWATESQTSLRLCRPQDQGLGETDGHDAIT